MYSYELEWRLVGLFLMITTTLVLFTDYMYEYRKKSMVAKLHKLVDAVEEHVQEFIEELKRVKRAHWVMKTKLLNDVPRYTQAASVFLSIFGSATFTTSLVSQVVQDLITENSIKKIDLVQIKLESLRSRLLSETIQIAKLANENRPGGSPAEYEEAEYPPFMAPPASDEEAEYPPFMAPPASDEEDDIVHYVNQEVEYPE